jgi:regulator of sirC expression with transglutaminase-like and TPR domain
MKNQPSACAEHSEKQINALIHLLSDQDSQIAQTIHDQLVAVGQPALLLLQQAQGGPDESTMSDRIGSVIADIKLFEVEHLFTALMTSSSDPINLETGAFLIAKAAYPDLDVQASQHQIENMVAVLKPRLEKSIPPRQAIQTISEYLFHELGFTGNTRDYYDPANSFLHQVLERRIGIPISLSVLYLLVGQRLNVPVVGIGLPGHFMVGLQTEPVFIDCFNQGVVLYQKDCAKFLQEYGVEFESRYLDPTPNEHILGRMLRNLVAIYQNRDESHQADRFSRLLAIIEHMDIATPSQ